MGLKSKLEIILAFILIVVIVIILCGSGAEAFEKREYILKKALAWVPGRSGSDSVVRVGKGATERTNTVCGGQTVIKRVLRRGETLWEVYEEYGNGLKWQKWLYEMEKVNGKSGNDSWYYGEEITVLVCH